ncbi:MAG: hypothetical protein IT267_11880 [Saprospiraceae bacterium]|nr:hypothetical protein [Saprospiraceae bacterium]
MKNFIFLLVSILILLGLNSCKLIDDLLDDSPCGPKSTADIYLLGQGQTSDKYLNTYMDGNNRVFQWSELVENVCTEEHIISEFRIAMFDPSSITRLNIKARGKVSYQFLYEKNIELQPIGLEFKAKLETGIKNAFVAPDLNGWFVHSVEVYFPTKGSLEADKNFLFPIDKEGNFQGEIISIEVKSKHRIYKK